MDNNQLLATYAIRTAKSEKGTQGAINITINHLGGKMELVGNQSRRHFRIKPLMKKANYALREKCWQIVAYCETYGNGYPERHKMKDEPQKPIK